MHDEPYACMIEDRLPSEALPIVAGSPTSIPEGKAVLYKTKDEVVLHLQYRKNKSSESRLVRKRET